MNEQEWAERIAAKLDQGLDDLPRGTLHRLRLAREAALARLHADEPSLQSSNARRPAFMSRWVLVPVFTLILGLSGLLMWEPQAPQKSEFADLDAQMLSDELPVTAYLDQGFETWLSHQSTD